MFDYISAYRRNVNSNLERMASATIALQKQTIT